MWHPRVYVSPDEGVSLSRFSLSAYVFRPKLADVDTHTQAVEL